LILAHLAYVVQDLATFLQNQSRNQYLRLLEQELKQLHQERADATEARDQVDHRILAINARMKEIEELLQSMLAVKRGVVRMV
jgi:hypothetical protein